MPRPNEPPWLVPPGPNLRVWALEPYFGGSHQQFLEGFVRHSAHHVSLHTLPARHWKWRMHGGAFALARRSHETATEQPDVLFVSDMLDLPVYLALAHPAVRRAPVLLYFHENQLTYPLPPGVERDLGYGMKHLSSALVAETVLFNSAYHRTEFLEAARGLLASLPDEVPWWALEEIARKSRVLPLGCDLARLDRFRLPHCAPSTGRWGDRSQGPLLLWNQRWEYDKAPGDLFRALYCLQDRGVAFRLAVAGTNRGLPSAEFVDARQRLSSRIVQWGRVEDLSDYAALLWEADVVVSTARHEFFGVAVVEAIYCGCRPVLPARLSYPELIPKEMHDKVLYGEGDLVPTLIRALEEGLTWSADWQRTWVSPFDWETITRRYDGEVWSCWERGTSRFPGFAGRTP